MPKPWPLWRALARPKRGNRDEEYEDAVAANVKLGRFAVADGATESSFAGQWAELLTDQFTQSAQPITSSSLWEAWLPEVRKAWQASVGSKPLAWYAEAKRDEGAFATFLGLNLSAKSWQVLSVGDCCFVQLRGSLVRQTFPMSSAKDFGNAPQLVGSRTGNIALQLAEGAAESGDRLLLMTDAMAQWFLSEAELGHDPAKVIQQLHSAPASFGDWVEQRRDRQEMRNDDVTLLIVDIP